MSIENTEQLLKIEFKSDWAEILGQKLVEMGYSVDPKWDAADLCLRYFNILKRSIKPKMTKRMLLS